MRNLRGGALALALTLGLAWWWWAPGMPAQLADVPVFTPTLAAVKQAVASAVARVSAPTLPTPEPQRLPANAAVWDLCGIGRLPVPRGAEPLSRDGMQTLPAHLGAEPAAQALMGLVQNLDAGDDRARAAAVLVRGEDSAGRPRQAALSALSAASADPVLAMWASDRCPDAQRCDAAALLRWRELEPGNAAAWLTWMRGHPERQAEAVQGLARATRFDIHGEALLAAALAATPAGTPAYLEPALWAVAIGIEAARPVTSTYSAAQLCKPPLAADRLALCQHLAMLMTEQADSMLARGAGLRLGERLGWPADKLKTHRDALNSAEVAASAWLKPAQPLSCASVDAMRLALQARTRGPAAFRPGGDAPANPPPANLRP